MGAISARALKRHKAAEHGNGAAGSLRDVILGGQDGLVNVFGLVVGVAAGTGSAKAVIVAGLAGAFAESISMAAVAYTSSKASIDYYESERQRELREMREVPDIEREEIRQIYRAKGFAGKLLNSIVEHVTRNKKLWLNTMMTDELHLSKEHDHPGKSAVIVGFSAIIGSFIPLTPFFFLPPTEAIPYAVIVSTLALFATGAIKAKLTVGKWWKSGIELTVIGMLAAITGYLIGWWAGTLA